MDRWTADRKYPVENKRMTHKKSNIDFIGFNTAIYILFKKEIGALNERRSGGLLADLAHDVLDFCDVREDLVDYVDHPEIVGQWDYF